MTTYFSITAEGGRLGRIIWNNSQVRTSKLKGCRPYHCFGTIEWDHHWPGLSPSRWWLDQIRKVIQDLGDHSAAVGVTFASMTPLYKQFGAVVSKASEVKFKVPASSATDDPLTTTTENNNV